MSGSDSIRLDRLLHFIRFTKTRSLAQAIIEQGHVRVDGRPAAKANTAIRAGQVVTIPIANQIRVIRLAIVPARRGPAAEARACYEEISNPIALSAD